MSNTVAVETARFHLSLNVNDLNKSVSFLTALLGEGPKKQHSDYAKFEPENLPLVLSLAPRSTPQAPLQSTTGEGALNHVGLRLNDAAQLLEVQQRMEAAGYSTQREDGVECCYARQTKFWVFDSDRTMWEVYVLEEDLAHRDGQHESPPLQAAVRLQGISFGPPTWQHRLNEPFPATLPQAGKLAEVTLQGTWNAREHVDSWSDQLAKVRAALRPGGKLILHILTANEPVDKLDPLPGPASVVQVVPQLSKVLELLQENGFQQVQLLKYRGSACFTQRGIEMRETRLEALTPQQPPVSEEKVTVVFKGPAIAILLEGDLRFNRAEPQEVSPRIAQQLATGPLSESFVFFSASPGAACASPHLAPNGSAR